MTLFAPDLYRSFGLGFVAGGLLIAAATVDQWSDAIEPPAQAAAPLTAPEPSGEFLIEPLEIDG